MFFNRRCEASIKRMNCYDCWCSVDMTIHNVSSLQSSFHQNRDRLLFPLPPSPSPSLTCSCTTLPRNALSPGKSMRANPLRWGEISASKLMALIPGWNDNFIDSDIIVPLPAASSKVSNRECEFVKQSSGMSQQAKLPNVWTYQFDVRVFNLTHISNHAITFTSIWFNTSLPSTIVFILHSLQISKNWTSTNGRTFTLKRWNMEVRRIILKNLCSLDQCNRIGFSDCHVHNWS